MSLLTADQMAKELNMSVKTFYKRVRKYSVPFVDAGQRLFDPEKVLRALETTMGEKVKIGTPKAKRRSTLVLEENKYRKILGI